MLCSIIIFNTPMNCASTHCLSISCYPFHLLVDTSCFPNEIFPLVMHADAPLSTMMGMESESKVVTLVGWDCSLGLGTSAILVTITNNLLVAKTLPIYLTLLLFLSLLVHMNHWFLFLLCFILINLIDACIITCKHE